MGTDQYDVDITDDGRTPEPKTWGRRVYADKAGRELLNDASAAVARLDPDDVADPANPSLAECLRHIDRPPNGPNHPKADALTRLLGYGMTFQEAVFWYWFASARFSYTDIHFAASGIGVGGDPGARRDAVEDIVGVLKSAAAKHPDADPADVADPDR